MLYYRMLYKRFEKKMKNITQHPKIWKWAHPTEKGTNDFTCEPCHDISNNVVCLTSKVSHQLAHMRSLIRAFACLLNIL